MVTNALSIRSSKFLMRRFGGALFCVLGLVDDRMTKGAKYFIMWALERRYHPAYRVLFKDFKRIKSDED